MKNLAEFFWGLEMFQTEVLEKIETHFMTKNVFRISWLLWGKVQKYDRFRQAVDFA